MKKNIPSICFFGCGEIAAHHVKILKKLYPGINLYFWNRTTEKGEAYNQLFHGKGFFRSIEEAVNSDAYEIAFITTPHAFHEEIAVKAAANKKDIIIEKPVTRNLKELDRIIKAVNKNGVRCTVAENYMFKPILKKINKIISKGSIGVPLTVSLNKVVSNRPEGWRMDPEIMGGGALLEGGIHWVNILTSLAGAMPESVIGIKPGVDYQQNAPFEDTIDISVKFSNGVTGKLFHSWKIPNSLKGLSLSKIYGTEGILTLESNGLFAISTGNKRRFSMVNPSDFLGFKAMHRSFIDNYINGSPWEPSIDRIRTELSLVEAAYKSLKSGKMEAI